MKSNSTYDVIIIGGSYAGLSAAMALGRSLRKVLILDSGLPCNRYTPHSHNFITQDGATPASIAEAAREQVLSYQSVQLLQSLALSARKTANGFSVTTDEGLEFESSRLILATGLRDEFPDIEGFESCWGVSVIHCPYCHGFEFRGQKTGIMANGERAIHIATLVRNLTEEVSIFTMGKADFKDADLDRLKKHRIEVVETAITGIRHENGNLKELILEDGSTQAFSALYAAIPFRQHSEIPALLGCELTESGHIKVDMFQKTSVEGVFACGDCATMMRSVAAAIGSGNLAGAMANHALSAEEF